MLGAALSSMYVGSWAIFDLMLVHRHVITTFTLASSNTLALWAHAIKGNDPGKALKTRIFSQTQLAKCILFANLFYGGHNVVDLVSRMACDCRAQGKARLVGKIDTYAKRTVVAFVLMTVVPCSAVVAQPVDDQSCSYSSTDPDDRSGPPIHFFADLSDGPQRAPTESAGVGRADFVLERDTLKLSWRISFKDLTSQPVGLHIHGPVPAEGNAPVMFDLALERLSSPVKGEKVVTLGEVAFLIQNLAFVNIHTANYPLGELRGPVRKIRPTC